MSDRNEPVSEKSSKSKGDVAGANGASVSASANNNSKKWISQRYLRLWYAYNKEIPISLIRSVV